MEQRRREDFKLIEQFYYQIRTNWVVLVFLGTCFLGGITWYNQTNTSIEELKHLYLEHESRLDTQDFKINKNEELLNKAMLDSSNSLGKIYERLGSIEGILSRLIR